MGWQRRCSREGSQRRRGRCMGCSCRGLLDSSGVGSWVADDDESWLLELLGVLVGKSTWSPLSTEVVGLGVGGELEDSSLGVLSVGHDQNILGVLDGGNDSSRDHELLPGLGDVEVVDTLLVSGVDVGLHLLGAVLSSNVDSGRKHESEILLFGFGVSEVAHF